VIQIPKKQNQNDREQNWRSGHRQIMECNEFGKSFKQNQLHLNAAFIRF
jgi:hypothetical protein